MSDLYDTDVVIVGGGPVGLTMAIELGSRGVRCMLVERNAESLFLPKMELCNPRTMEIFQQLGVAEKIRSAGYHPDLPMDVVITRKMTEPPIARLKYPAVNIATRQNAAVQDGSAPREVYQRISQYTLEPLLREVAETYPSVSVHFSTTLTEVDQDETGVSVALVGDFSEPVRARYLVACDGATSTVRRALNIDLKGHSQGPELCHVFFRSADLMEGGEIEPARHFYILGDRNATIITQDTPEYFGMHAAVPPTADVETLIDELVGRPVTKTILHVGTWQPRLLIAERYTEGRIFLAGDAAHQYIPFGGYGMNTGVGDVHDLAWKLAAVLNGWGGDALLESYDAERRPVGARNLAASEENTLAMFKWRKTYDAGMQEGLPQATVDAQTAAIADIEQRRSHERTAIELGYSYAGSPVLAPEPGDNAPDPGKDIYKPSAAPGNRLPHRWLPDGRSVHDLLGKDFTLLTLDGSDDALPLVEAFRHACVPLETAVLDDADTRALMERRFILIRPDGHVAWRSNELPQDTSALIQKVTGQSQ